MILGACVRGLVGVTLWVGVGGGLNQPAPSHARRDLVHGMVGGAPKARGGALAAEHLREMFELGREEAERKAAELAATVKVRGHWLPALLPPAVLWNDPTSASRGKRIASAFFAGPSL